MLRKQREREIASVDMESVRRAVARIIESERFDDWLVEMPDHVLVEVAAPLEMLQFQHYLMPPKDRYLVRSARVVWDAVADLLADCPSDLAAEFASLGASLKDRSMVSHGQG
ncbi:hypothetical protein ACFXI8_25635 [Streptomyces niveus]|uniref:hypothetical protein n=1 Tax=Streptomyces niveus TaxID=193462 RepID=UPI00367C7D06